MAQVLSQFSVQGSLDQQFGQLLAQPVFANEVLRLPVVGQQANSNSSGKSCFLLLMVLTDRPACAGS